VVFEDSPAGLQAAHAAGMKPVFVKDMVQPEPSVLGLVWRSLERLDEAAVPGFLA
jgi:beta-phosphoglucomutase-like phosphatase (HAD superfamily)